MSGDKSEKKSIDPFIPLRRRPGQTESALSIASNVYGPFEDIVALSEAKVPYQNNFDRAGFSDLVSNLCIEGRPKLTLDGNLFAWHRGLVSLCNPETEGNLGAAAQEHARVMSKLYLRLQHEDDNQSSILKYDDLARPSTAMRPGRDLVPGFKIYNREQLSEAYINGLLRPYLRAESACRQKFWQHLQTGHESGAWIGLLPTEQGTFVPMVPGAGFGVGRNYTIDRKTYLQGFGFNEEDVGIENYPHTKTYPMQDHWLFLGADQFVKLFRERGEAFALEGREPAATKTNESQPNVDRSKVLPRGYGRADRHYVLIGVGLVRSKKEASANSAALHLVNQHETDIKGSSFEAKVTRLRKAIAAALEQREDWKHDRELAKILQNYPD